MKINFDADDMRPLIAAVVQEVLAQRQADQSRLGDDRLTYTEPEAAALIGVAPHVLRDCRQRGEVRAVRIGKRFCYNRAEILRFIGLAPEAKGKGAGR